MTIPPTSLAVAGGQTAVFTVASTGAVNRAYQWRRNGAGSQILAALGVRHLRVLGTPRRQVGLAGFGLEVVEYVVLPAR